MTEKTPCPFSIHPCPAKIDDCGNLVDCHACKEIDGQDRCGGSVGENGNPKPASNIWSAKTWYPYMARMDDHTKDCPPKHREKIRAHIKEVTDKKEERGELIHKP